MVSPNNTPIFNFLKPVSSPPWTFSIFHVIVMFSRGYGVAREEGIWLKLLV